MIRRLLIAGSVLVLAPLVAVSGASAQTTPPTAPPTDGPMATARREPVASPDAAPVAPSKAPPIARTDDLPYVAPDEHRGPRPKRQQVFISPMGEPFRTDFGKPYPVEAWFKQVDANGDGSITLEEFKADALRFFKTLDENHDGTIDGFEVADYEANVAPEILPRVADGLSAQDVLTQEELAKSGNRRRRAEDAFAGGPGRNPKGTLRDAMTGAAVYGFLAEPEPVRGSDADLDFKVTQAEWLAAAARRFDKLDKNHDHKLDRAELPLTPMQNALIEEDKRREKEAAKDKGKKG
jgi:hypothetical protein